MSRLPSFSINDINNKRKLYYRNRIEFYKECGNTLSNLGERLGVNASTVIRWVKGRNDANSSMPNLAEKGLVKIIKINPLKQTTPYLLYKVDMNS